LEALLLSVPGTPRWEIEAFNISPKGLAFRSARKFKVGEYFVLNLDLEGMMPRLVLCQVKYCREKMGHEHHEVGVEMKATVPNTSGQVVVPEAWMELGGCDVSRLAAFTGEV